MRPQLAAPFAKSKDLNIKIWAWNCATSGLCTLDGRHDIRELPRWENNHMRDLMERSNSSQGTSISGHGFPAISPERIRISGQGFPDKCFRAKDQSGRQDYGIFGSGAYRRLNLIFRVAELPNNACSLIISRVEVDDYLTALQENCPTGKVDPLTNNGKDNLGWRGRQ